MLHQKLVPLATTATLLLSTLSLPAQQLTEGFSETTSSLPAGTSNLFTTSTGMIYFDDLDPIDNPAGIDKVLENCRWDYGYGYRQFKVKIGRGNKWMPAKAGLERDIDVVNAIHKAFPASTSWSTATTVSPSKP